MIYSVKEKNFIEKQYAREVWLGKRGIGGSDVGALMQVSKWQTFNDVFNRLLGKAKDKDDLAKKNKRVAEGQKAEKYIWNLYAIEHPDKKVVTAAINKVWLFFSNKNVRITVSPDALVQIGSGDDKEYTEGVEIKDVEVHSKKELEKWQTGNIPEQYFYQVMQYMVVINTLKKVTLVARIKVMKEKELDHIEEYYYEYSRKEWKDTIKFVGWLENEFIERYVNKNKRPNANYLEELKKEYETRNRASRRNKDTSSDN